MMNKGLIRGIMSRAKKFKRGWQYARKHSGGGRAHIDREGFLRWSTKFPGMGGKEGETFASWPYRLGFRTWETTHPLAGTPLMYGYRLARRGYKRTKFVPRKAISGGSYYTYTKPITRTTKAARKIKSSRPKRGVTGKDYAVTTSKSGQKYYERKVPESGGIAVGYAIGRHPKKILVGSAAAITGAATLLGPGGVLMRPHGRRRNELPLFRQWEEWEQEHSLRDRGKSMERSEEPLYERPRTFRPFERGSIVGDLVKALYMHVPPHGRKMLSSWKTFHEGSSTLFRPTKIYHLSERIRRRLKRSGLSTRKRKIYLKRLKTLGIEGKSSIPRAEDEGRLLSRLRYTPPTLMQSQRSGNLVKKAPLFYGPQMGAPGTRTRGQATGKRKRRRPDDEELIRHLYGNEYVGKLQKALGNLNKVSSDAATKILDTMGSNGKIKDIITGLARKGSIPAIILLGALLAYHARKAVRPTESVSERLKTLRGKVVDTTTRGLLPTPRLKYPDRYKNRMLASPGFGTLRDVEILPSTPLYLRQKSGDLRKARWPEDPPEFNPGDRVRPIPEEDYRDFGPGTISQFKPRVFNHKYSYKVLFDGGGARCYGERDLELFDKSSVVDDIQKRVSGTLRMLIRRYLKLAQHPRSMKIGTVHSKEMWRTLGKIRHEVDRLKAARRIPKSVDFNEVIRVFSNVVPFKSKRNPVFWSRDRVAIVPGMSFRTTPKYFSGISSKLKPDIYEPARATYRSLRNVPPWELRRQFGEAIWSRNRILGRTPKGELWFDQRYQELIRERIPLLRRLMREKGLTYKQKSGLIPRTKFIFGQKGKSAGYRARAKSRFTRKGHEYLKHIQDDKGPIKSSLIGDIQKKMWYRMTPKWGTELSWKSWKKLPRRKRLSHLVARAEPSAHKKQKRYLNLVNALGEESGRYDRGQKAFRGSLGKSSIINKIAGRLGRMGILAARKIARIPGKARHAIAGWSMGAGGRSTSYKKLPKWYSRKYKSAFTAGRHAGWKTRAFDVGFNRKLMRGQGIGSRRMVMRRYGKQYKRGRAFAKVPVARTAYKAGRYALKDPVGAGLTASFGYAGYRMLKPKRREGY